MREIKFRAWDNLLRQMMTNVEGAVEMSRRTEFEVMQYTGLHDKNGKETYCKDVCLDEFGNRWLIEWSDEYAGFELSLIYSLHEEIPKLNICRVIDIEVIGNIYENPELLKENSNG